MCPEESANCENGKENTDDLMNGKPPCLDAIYLNYRNLLTFISCHVDDWVHTKNKVSPFPQIIMHREKDEGLTETENF